jgi:hypothetical protein
VDLRNADRVFQTLVSVLEDALRRHGSSNQEARRLADATLLLAAGLSDVRDLYAAACGAEPVDGQPPTAASAELFRVLRQDLAELAVHALDRYFANIADGAPLAVDADRFHALAAGLFADYTDQLATSVLRQPAMIGDAEPRRLLISALWQHSAHAREILRAGPRSELLALCRSTDLRLMSRDRAAAVVLRFAPTHVQAILTGASVADTVAVDTNLVGVVRLAPLLPGRVRVVQATVTDLDQQIPADLLGPTSGVES